MVFAVTVLVRYLRIRRSSDLANDTDPCGSGSATTGKTNKEQNSESYQNHLLSKLHMIATTIPLGSFLSSWTECGAEKLNC
jgi:hypothetical protein